MFLGKVALTANLYIYILHKSCSENMQSNFIEIAIWHGCSPVNWLHIFSTPFPKNTSGWKKIMHFSPTKIESLLYEGWEVCISLQPHGHFFDITKRASIFFNETCTSYHNFLIYNLPLPRFIKWKLKTLPIFLIWYEDWTCTSDGLW